jgi:hypothetical protein
VHTFDRSFKSLIGVDRIVTFFGGQEVPRNRGAYIFRSFDNPHPPRYVKYEDLGDHLNSGKAHQASLWEVLSEVARATSAAPTYFPAFKIEGVGKFIDGEMGANNPSFLAYREVRQVHGRRIPILVLSIGCGDQEKENKKPSRRKLFRLPEHQRDLQEARKDGTKLVTDTKKAHDRMNNISKDSGEHPPPQGPMLYFRLNVPRMPPEILLDDWRPRRSGKKPKDAIAKPTMSYLGEPDTQAKLIRCAIKLVELRRESSKTERWEKFATHVVYSCPLNGSNKCKSLPFSCREDLRQHGTDKHGFVSRGRDKDYLCTCYGCYEDFEMKEPFIMHIKASHSVSNPTIKTVREMEAWLD